MHLSYELWVKNTAATHLTASRHTCTRSHRSSLDKVTSKICEMFTCKQAAATILIVLGQSGLRRLSASSFHYALKAIKSYRALYRDIMKLRRDSSI